MRITVSPPTAKPLGGAISTTNQAINIDVGTGEYTQSANVDVSSGNGAITITADRLSLALGTISTTGALTLQPLASTTVGVGSAAAGDFNLTDTELGLLTTGGTLTLGRSDAGAVEIDSAYLYL